MVFTTADRLDDVTGSAEHLTSPLRMATIQPAPGLRPDGLTVSFIEEIAMFQVQTPVVIVPSVEARAALGVQLQPAAVAAAWREIVRRGQGIEMAHFQIVHTGVTASSRSSSVSA